MDELVGQRCGMCKRVKPLTDFAASHRDKNGRWCTSCFAAYFRGEDPWVPHQPLTCTYCGEQYIPKNLKTVRKFCSPQCKNKARNARWAVENQAKKPLVRVCAGCGAGMSQAMRSDARYCSDRCNSDANSAHRYARTRGAQAEEFFTLDEIYARDLGVCYLCHLECVRSDASMDHVIPVSLHGSHTRANVKLAHHGCNSRKKDHLLSELSWYVPMT